MMHQMQTEIEQKHEQIKALEAEIAELRQTLPAEPVGDYSFATPDGDVALSALFGDKDELIMVHNMGFACQYCTMWADGFNAVYRHIEERAAFAVASPDNVTAQAKGSDKRGWRFRMVSAEGTSFFADMGFEADDGSPWPGVSVFRRNSDGAIERHASAPFGPGDKFCSVWSFFELLPG